MSAPPAVPRSPRTMVGAARKLSIRLVYAPELTFDERLAIAEVLALALATADYACANGASVGIEGIHVIDRVEAVVRTLCEVTR